MFFTTELLLQPHGKVFILKKILYTQWVSAKKRSQEVKEFLRKKIKENFSEKKRANSERGKKICVLGSKEDPKKQCGVPQAAAIEVLAAGKTCNS